MHISNLSILILGITGDLSKRKILPSIGVLSNIYKNINIELLGYSRSKPNFIEIEEYLNLKQKHRLKNINFIQADYTDTKKLQEIVSNKLQNGYYVILYLAIPPFLFEGILKNLCIFGENKISIVIEKPFGENFEEAKKIIQDIKNCKLTENTKFFDHYLFKDGLNVQKELIKKYITKPDQILIKAKENITIEGRENYYEKVGAIKDMLPSHLYSLLKRTYFIFKLIFDIKNLEFINVNIGQYKEYPLHSKNPNTKTETYFKIIIFDTKNKIKIILESGKRLNKKETSITIKDNKEKIYWQIDPTPFVKIKNIIYETQVTNIPEHAKLIMQLIENKNKNFVTEEEIIEGWQLYDLVSEYISKNKPHLFVY